MQRQMVKEEEREEVRCVRQERGHVERCENAWGHAQRVALAMAGGAA